MAYTTINKSSEHFNTKLYTGNGTLGHAITGVGHQPDFVWIKNRDQNNRHTLHDVVRGVTKRLRTDGTDAEDTTDPFTSFDSDGFTLNSTGGGMNGNTENYVSWNWKAGGAGSSNTDGSITSTVSANTTSGFSIVQYTGNGTAGATFGHGLGVMPSHIIIKRTSSSEAWVNWHSTFSALQYLRLYQNTAIESSTNLFNNTLPTSSVVSLGTGGFTNTNGETYIAYCFAEKTGYSKFGSYVSNNNADGTFVYTGFKPTFLLLKNVTTANTGWELYDNKRTPNNVANLFLRPNTTDADISSDRLDILSNGFKLRQVGDTNANSDTIIYMAFGQSLVGSNNIPCTAR